MCSEQDCTKPATRRGMCHTHYEHWRRRVNGELSVKSLPSITHADWTIDASCAQSDPRSWFPEDLGLGVKGTRARIEMVKRVCADCPVRQACARDYWDEPHGIIAGYTADERRQLKGRIEAA